MRASRQARSGEVGTGTPEVDYAYDDGASNGEAKYVRLSSVTYPNGGVVHYNYPADGVGAVLSRLDNIASSATPSASEKFVAYTYIGAWTIVKVEHPAVASGSGLTLSYGSEGTYDAWDRFGRVVDQTWTVEDDPVDSYGYTYDGNSNRLTRSNPLHTAYGESYAYDGLDRLTGMERATSTHQDWGLDALGNWAGYVESDGETTTLDQSRTHDEANQIGEIDATIGEDWIDPTYDDAGNMVYAPRPDDEADADEALLFVYDGWNRLVKVYKDNGENNGGQIGEGDTLLATYEYDGLGRRIQKTVGETTDDYYYNEGWQVLETRRGGDPDPLDQYVWDVRYVDAPVVRFHDGNTDGDLDGGSQEGDNTLYYTTDANWNVTALVDAGTGDVVERYMYDAYGKATVMDEDWTPRQVNASAVSNDILYAGYRFDAETGLYATDRRIYHPTLGRWLGRDGGYVDGMNLYQYCRGNPIALTDPTGMCGGTAPVVDGVSGAHGDPGPRGEAGVPGADLGWGTGDTDLFLRPPDAQVPGEMNPLPAIPTLDYRLGDMGTDSSAGPIDLGLYPPRPETQGRSLWDYAYAMGQTAVETVLGVADIIHDVDRAEFELARFGVTWALTGRGETRGFVPLSPYAQPDYEPECFKVAERTYKEFDKTLGKPWAITLALATGGTEAVKNLPGGQLGVVLNNVLETGDFTPQDMKLVTSTAIDASLLYLGGRIAEAPVRGGAGPVRVGQAGQAVTTEMYGARNTESFLVNGRYRIPDHVLAQDINTRMPTRTVETKNVRYQSLTLQLRDYVDLAGPGGRVDVALPPGARVSGPLQRAFDNPRNPLNRIDLIVP